MERDEHHERTAPPLPNPNKAKTIKHRGQEAKRQALYRMSGVDATHIDAIGVETVAVVLSEYGPDLSRFPTEKQFVSHVTLAPCAQKRRQAREEEKAEQREHARSGGIAHGSAVAAPQPDRPGSLLSQDGATPQWRYCRVRYRPEARYSDLPAAALGPDLYRRRGRSIRRPLSPAAHRTLDGYSQTTRLSANSRKRLRITQRMETSHRLAEGKIGHAVGGASKELLQSESVRYAALSSMGTSS